MHQIVVDSINRTDLDLRRDLYSNIVLSGGSTLTKGFGDRLLTEVQKLAVKDMRIKIFAPPERKYSTWIGGSILAGLSTFRKVCPRMCLCVCAWTKRKIQRNGAMMCANQCVIMNRCGLALTTGTRIRISSIRSLHDDDDDNDKTWERRTSARAGDQGHRLSNKQKSNFSSYIIIYPDLPATYHLLLCYPSGLEFSASEF